ncbi:uncharacterized protein LOC128996812 [Macrosteles quadrilineatus]|uniref:uncharacterized protein LOC128996812 n=1 Tax=Macrosteles quadrilineatus TaxID=74068 RepID=UPI0023E27455|nr:uncharacterized protein LOC128996812 [Macrosteles quadrilineatus]
MAARKLKFKPKPVVGGALRRPREKDDVPELSQQPTIQEPTNANVTGTSNLESNNPPENASDEGNVAKRNKLEHCENILTVTDVGSEKSGLPDSNTSTAESNVVKNYVNETSQESASAVNSDICTALNLPIEQTARVNIGKQGSSESVINLSVCSRPSKLVDPSKNSASNEPSSEAGFLTPNFVEECDADSKSVNKKVTKGAPRFGRSKFKPVLNNGSRKKNELNLDPDTDKNVKSNVYPVAIIRTSVIKSVESETKNVNIVSEITASFASLESDESESSENQSQTKEKEFCPNTFRFCGPSVAKSKTTTREPFINSDQEQQPSSSDLLSRPDQPNQNQVDQTLNKSNSDETNRTDQVSSPTKVPISPLKLSSKVLVPKPSPNLLDPGVRRISFQGSDSEDDTKKNLFLLNHAKLGKRTKRDKDAKSTKRKLSQGSTYSKLGQEALIKFNEKFGKPETLVDPPDKAKLTMLDLIFYNPKSNPMSVSTEQTKGRKKEDKVEMNLMVAEAVEEEKVDDVEEEPTTPAVPVPQLKVGPDGQIMLDPRSLVIETTEVKEKRAVMEKSGIVRETGITRYNTYSKKKHIRKDWTALETLQFYKALNTIGSDFSLMTKLFPNRTRHDLKLKFKKEEKINMKLIDRAMTAPADFDFASLQKELQEENDELARIAEKKKTDIENAKRARAIKKEDNVKPRKKELPARLRRKGAAFLSFDEPEMDTMKTVKKAVKKRKKRKRKVKTEMLIVSSSDEEDINNVDSDECELATNEARLLKMIKMQATGGVRKYRPKHPKKLKEYEEINETLKTQLKDIDSDISDDEYTPNGLFHSPVRDPFPEDQDKDTNQWSMEVTTSCGVENILLLKNVQGDPNLSELSTVEQNESAQDLSSSLPTSVREGRQSGHKSTILNRHFISESIQIIDQLTANENLNENSDNTSHKQNEGQSSRPSRVDEEPRESLIPLPSFESMNRSHRTVCYDLENQYDLALHGGDNVHVCETNSSSTQVLVIEEDENNVNRKEIFSRPSEEAILGN